MLKLTVGFIVVCMLLSAAVWAESPTQWTIGYDGSDANTVSLWHMNEGAGSSAADVKGIKSFTDFYGNYPTWVTGEFGAALKFNGTSTAAYAFGPNPGYAFGVNPFTVECWLNPAEQSGMPFIFDNTGNWSLRLGETANSLEAYIGDLDGGIAVTSGAVLTPNVWQHVAMTSGGAGGKLRLWINGSVVAETNISAEAVGNGGSSPQITMGRWTYGGAYYFDGAVDEMRISNVERTFAPVPEPASLLILASGVLGIIIRRKR